MIRPFVSADRAPLVELWRDCGLVVAWNDPGRDIDRKLAVDPEGLLVALDDTGVVGSVMVGYEGHRGWINYLAVAPSHRSTGLGRELMAGAEAILRTRGCAKINLQVRSSNEAVVAFYESLGYTIDPVTSLGKRLVDDT